MTFLALAPEVDKNQSWFDVFSGLGSRSRQNQSQKSRFDELVSLAPGVGKISPRGFDLMMLYAAEVNQNPMQKSRFDDALALAPEVDKVSPSNLDLKTSRPCFQKSTCQQNQLQKSRFHDFWLWVQESAKAVPKVLIWWLSGLGSGGRQNLPWLRYLGWHPDILEPRLLAAGLRYLGLGTEADTQKSLNTRLLAAGLRNLGLGT